MKRILGLIVAAGLGTAWAAPAQAQLMTVVGSPYTWGSYVSAPAYYGYYTTPTYYYTTPTYYSTTPTYYTSSNSYPSTTYYSSGYSGSVAPTTTYTTSDYYVPSTNVYTYAYPTYWPSYSYYPYRRGLFGRWRGGW